MGEGDAQRVVVELVVVQCGESHDGLGHGVHTDVRHGAGGLEELEHGGTSLE